MSQPISLFVLIPAFEAGDTLGAVLDEVLGLGIPAIVVDDGSTDSTRDVAESREVREVLVHPKNRGKGAALKTGMRRAVELGFTHVLTFDADGQHPVEAVEDFLTAAEEHPQAILVGNRFADETIGAMPGLRRMSNAVSSKLISIAAQNPVGDAQCGMRVYPLEATLALGLESDGYAMESEVLVKAGRRGMEIANIPIPCHYPQGTANSRYRAIVDSCRIAKSVWRAMRD